jgi:hypothetical protein
MTVAHNKRKQGNMTTFFQAQVTEALFLFIVRVDWGFRWAL